MMRIAEKMKKELEIELRRRLIAYVLEQRGLSGCLDSTGKKNASKRKLVKPNSRHIARAISDLELEEIEDRALRTSLQQMWEMFLIDPRQNEGGKSWSRKTIDRDLEALREGECIDAMEQANTRLWEITEMVIIARISGDWSQEDDALLGDVFTAVEKLREKVSRAKQRAQGRNDDVEQSNRHQPELSAQESSNPPMNGAGPTTGAGE